MGIRTKKGFVIIIVVSLTALLMLLAWVIVNVGLGEILQSRIRNDLGSAFYVASAGAEYMFVRLKDSSVVTWGQTINGTLSISGTTIGTYSVTANTVSSNEFGIVSTGTVRGRTSTVTVKCGFSSAFTGGVPLGSIGNMTLTGASSPAKLKIEGPVMSNGTITESGSVDIAQGTVSGQAMPAPNFWLGAQFDTNNDGQYVADANGDGTVTRGEAEAAGQVAIFDADNAYAPSGDSEITRKDAFYYYYTTYLNQPGIAPGGSYYYTGDRSFSQGNVPNSVPIIFIDGNVTINQNDQDWQSSGVLNHTIVVMGTVDLYQPTNRPGDVLSVIAWGNVTTDGEMGNQGGTIGDLIIYTQGDFTALDGGKTNTSIFAEGTVTINTVGDDQGADHRMLNASTIDWTDPASRPLGLPPGYAIVSSSFIIENESTYKAIWQRN